MRVLLSAYVCDPLGGSEGANAWYTAEGLAHAGAEVHVLTRERDRSNTEAAIAGARGLTGTLSATYLPDNVPPFAGQLGVYAQYATWQARAHRWACDRRHGEWDVGHHIAWASLSHPIGLAGCPFPLVIGPVGGGQTLHPEHERWYDGTPRHERLRREVLRKVVPLNPLARAAVRTRCLVLATNNESAALAKALGARRVQMQLADGVRDASLNKDPTAFPTAPTVVWIGRFLPLKAARLALQAFRIAAEHVPEARLIFVGDGPTLEVTRRDADDLVTRGSVEFTGHLPWFEGQSILARARVHLFTSVRDSFGAQTLEAAALGIPTVALDVFGARAFLHRTGFDLVDPLPGEGLDGRVAEALVRALTWPQDEWLEQSRGAMAFAQRQAYRERAMTYLEYYAALKAESTT